MHKQITDQDDPSIPPPSPQTPSHSQSPPAWQSNHDTPKNKMEKTMYKYSTEDEENDDIAVRSVLEMGYSRPTVHSVIEQLRKQGMTFNIFTFLIVV